MIKIGQTLYDNRGFCKVEAINGENPIVTNIQYPEGTRFVTIVAKNGRWSDRVSSSQAESMRLTAIQKYYENVLRHVDIEKLEQIKNNWHNHLMLSFAASAVYNRRSHAREYCPECGQHWIFHTNIPASAIQPSEDECPPTDFRDRFDIESGDWKANWNDTYQQLGWDNDIIF